MTVGNGTGQDKQTLAVRRVGRRLLKRTLTTLPVLVAGSDGGVSADPPGAGRSDRADAGRRRDGGGYLGVAPSYGLDAPLGQQYMHYWRGIVHGNLGQSLRLHDSVLHLILQRYPYTLALTAAAMLLGAGIAIPAGVYSATPARQVAGPRRGRGKPVRFELSELRAGADSDCGLLRSGWGGCRFRERVRGALIF